MNFFCLFSLFFTGTTQVQAVQAASPAATAGLSGRHRRASLLREEHAHLIPKSITTFSPMRDNVITMVAFKMKNVGLNKSQIRESLDAIFSHGCHCGWNYGRHELSDKSLKPKGALDKICLDFEHCAECVKMDGCDLDQDFMPIVNGTSFSCDHLVDNPCQMNTCRCSTNMADRVMSGLREFEFNKMGFSEFMSTCTGEVEAAINTQMFNVFGQQRGLELKKERQCCGEYPNRRAFTYTFGTGSSCCANRNIFDQKYSHCCPNGEVIKIGDICW